MFYSSERELKGNQSAINDFYQNTLVKAYLNTPNGQLFYAHAQPDKAHVAIVISSGRIEGLDKYKELYTLPYADPNRKLINSINSF